MKPCGAVIMAAGRSRRMKNQKSALAFDEKSTFLFRILSQYHDFGCHPLIVVVNHQTEELLPGLLEGFSHEVTVAVNPVPEKGRFLSLQQGLKRLTSQQASFVHNVDNPFVSHELLAQMRRQAPDQGFVAPVYQSQGGHPLLLMPDVIEAILAHQQGETRLDHFLKAFAKKQVPSRDPGILVNLNTPEDYQRFLSLRQYESFQ